MYALVPLFYHSTQLMRAQCAQINNVTGEIAVCRGNRITLYSLNGAVLLEQVVCDSSDDTTLACVFYEGVGDEWHERELVFTGHKRGVVNVSSDSQGSGAELTRCRSGARSSKMVALSWS
jgi:hypothetical protein